MWDAEHYKIEQGFNVDGGGGEKLIEQNWNRWSHWSVSKCYPHNNDGSNFDHNNIICTYQQ